MSLSDNYPDIRPVWMNDYANAGVIDPRCSFTRSDSTPSDVHYWSEEDHLSSENLFKYSNDLSTGWLEDNVTFTGGQTAPDGGSDAYTITENSATNEHRFYPNAAIATDGGTTTFSGYFKYIGRQWIVVKLNDGSTDRRVWFDIQNGAVGTTNTGITASITASGGGYYKVVATIATSSTSYFPLVGGASADNVYVYAGSGADAFYVWGLQYNHNAGSVLSETSGQIHREYAATLKSVAYSGQPRFEYEPTGDRSAKGLLLESSSSNLIPYSSAINSWVTKGNVTITDAAAVGPNGTLSASLVRPTGATSLQHYIRENITTVASSSYTFSAYVKPAGYTKLLLVGEQTAWPYTDYANATFTLTGAGSVTTGAGSATITALSDGWYQITATGTAATTSSYALISVLNDAGDLVYTADSYSGILITAVQYEQNSFQSSYIATSGSASTRTADSLSVATADIGYTGGDATVFVESTSSGGDFPGLIGLDDGGSVNCMRVFRNSGSATSTTDFQFNVNDSSGSNQVASVVSGSGAGTKFAMRLAENNAAFAFDGNSPTTDTSCVMPVTTTLDIGSGAGVSQINGTIKRVALYNEALSDTNLQALTS